MKMTDFEITELIAKGLGPTPQPRTKPSDHDRIARIARELEALARSVATKHEAMAAHKRSIMTFGNIPPEWEEPT